MRSVCYQSFNFPFFRAKSFLFNIAGNIGKIHFSNIACLWLTTLKIFFFKKCCKCWIKHEIFLCNFLGQGWTNKNGPEFKILLHVQSIAEVFPFDKMNFHKVLVFWVGSLNTPIELLHNTQFTLGFVESPQLQNRQKYHKFCGHVQFGEVSKPVQ